MEFNLRAMYVCQVIAKLVEANEALSKAQQPAVAIGTDKLFRQIQDIKSQIDRLVQSFIAPED